MSCKIVCNILKSLLFSLFIRLEKVCDESLVAQTTRAAPKPCRRKRKIVSALSSPYMLFSLSAFQTADRSKTRKDKLLDGKCTLSIKIKPFYNIKVFQLKHISNFYFLQFIHCLSGYIYCRIQ